MWVKTQADRRAKVDRKILKVKAALADSVKERNKPGVTPRIYFEITDFIEELLEDLHALRLRRRLLDES